MAESDETLVKRFQTDGFVVVRNVYLADVIAALLREFDKAETQGGLGAADRGGYVTEDVNGTRSIKYLQGVNHSVRSFNRLQSIALLKLAEALLDDEVYFAEMELHDKAPRGGTETPPHQDNFYFCFDPPKALTVYVPLEKHGPENGGLEFLVGSHLAGVKPHKPSTVKAFSSFVTGFEGYSKAAPELEPGDIVVHHCNTVHMAGANQSGRRRRSVSMRINGVHAAVSEELRDLYGRYRAENRA